MAGSCCSHASFRFSKGLGPKRPKCSEQKSADLSVFRCHDAAAKGGHLELRSGRSPSARAVGQKHSTRRQSRETGRRANERLSSRTLLHLCKHQADSWSHTWNGGKSLDRDQAKGAFANGKQKWPFCRVHGKQHIGLWRPGGWWSLAKRPVVLRSEGESVDRDQATAAFASGKMSALCPVHGRQDGRYHGSVELSFAHRSVASELQLSKQFSSL
eukprot:Skav211776  [mRNA]  locus=scaffold305:66089:69659:+ [translate_table: standard]